LENEKENMHSLKAYTLPSRSKSQPHKPKLAKEYAFPSHIEKRWVTKPKRNKGSRDKWMVLSLE